MLCGGRTLSRLIDSRGLALSQHCFSSLSVIMADQGVGPRSGELPASDMPASAAVSYDSMEGVGPGQHHQQANHEGTRQSEQSDADASSVPQAKPTGALQDMDKNDLVAKRNQILWEQAVKGQQPGLSLMQDRLSGENKQETWGNEPSILEPDEQN